MFKSKSRIIISSIVSVILVFISFNFNPRDIAILATRSVGRQIFDYVLNFVIFFAAIYLIISLLIFVYNKFVPKSKK
jgi:surface polysaccharide O-acyltransferase-like enzyme